MNIEMVCKAMLATQPSSCLQGALGAACCAAISACWAYSSTHNQHGRVARQKQVGFEKHSKTLGC
jgi:hypothetical protein